MSDFIRDALLPFCKARFKLGVKQVFGMVGHSNLGLAYALRIQEEAGNLTYCGIRHEGTAAFGKVAQWSQTVLPSSKHAELINLALKSAILNRGVSHLVFPNEVQTLPAPVHLKNTLDQIIKKG